MIIGLGHVARVGKDVAAQALCRDLGFRRVAFADPLKALAYGSNPMMLAHQASNVGIGAGHLRQLVNSFGWDGVKDQFPEARKFLQNLGVAGRETFGEDFWVNQALNHVSPGENIVVSDVRFANEAVAIQNAGGKVVRINRPGKVATGHISETALVDFPFDAEVDNNGSIVELEHKIVELARGWLTVEAGRAERVEH
jgi:hypothetical protein